MGSNRLLFLASMALSGALQASDAPTTVPLEDFNRHSEYTAVRVSPNGEYLAATAPIGDRDVLVVLDMKDLKPIKVHQLPDNKSIAGFFWAGPDRLMFTATRKFGQFAQPGGTGEWYAVDANGERPRVLVTYEGTTASGSTSFSQRVSPVSALREDASRVLVQVTTGTGSEEGDRAELMEMDTFTGRMKRLARAPSRNCDFVLDADDKPAFANCADNKNRDSFTEGHGQVYRRVDGDWTKIFDSRETAGRLRVSHVDPDGTVYAVQHDNAKPNVMGRLDPQTGAFTPLDSDPRVDMLGEVIAADGKTLIGVTRMPGKPEVRFIREEHPDAQLLAQLSAAFPGQYVSLGGATLDGNKMIVSVQSDRNPGEFYLYDKSTKQARYLVSTRRWIDPEQMSEMRPFTMTARDGVTLSGYLTIPKGRELKGLPMIVNPHGGPHGPRDMWGFNPEVQLFANRGYLVLQVDFRGSGGYGKAFEQMGYGEWGGTMQDDVTDATKWAIAQGYADPDRICIYGASYGAYAALMGAVREPDLYRCTVGYVGVYDLRLMYSEGDIRESDTGGNYLESVIGKDRSKLDERSPAARADEIKIPVFLAAGGRDRRTPPEQTDAMEAALIAAGNAPRENILEPKEGHGFYEVPARNNIYSKMLAFFGEHIGGSVTVGESRTESASGGSD